MPKALYIAHLFRHFTSMFWPLSHYQDDTYKHTFYYQSLTALLQHISADIVTCICSAVDLTGVVTG